MKKSQSISLNTMVIALLALAALVLLLLFLGKGTGFFSSNAFNCESKGGNCVTKGQCRYQETDFNCAQDQVCCINPLKG